MSWIDLITMRSTPGIMTRPSLWFDDDGSDTPRCPETTHEKGETRFQYHPSCLAAQFETKGTRYVNGTSRADKSDNITTAKFHQELFLEHGEFMTWELQHRKVGKLVLAARWSMHLACCIWQSLFSGRSIGNILEHVLRKVVSNLKCQLCRSQLCWAVRSRSFA